MPRIFAVAAVVVLLVVVAYLAITSPGSASDTAVTDQATVTEEPTLVPLATATPSADSQSATVTPEPSAEPSTPAPTQPDPAPGALDPVEPDGEHLEPGVAAQPRDDAQQQRFDAYETRALDFMAVFARPAAGEQDQWWAKVEPFLAERVRGDYQGVDPSVVPFRKITGPAVLVPTDAPSDLLTVVLVPTEAGDYQVEMETDEHGIHVTRLVRLEAEETS